MKKRLWLAITFVAVLSLTLATSAFVVAPSAQAARTADLPDGKVVVRVYYDDPEDIRLLAGYDVFELNNKKEHYVLVAVDSYEYRAIQDMGFRLEIDAAQTAEFNKPLVALPGQINGIPNYPCYRTVEETFAAAQSIVANHPAMATWVDVGNSWEKSVGQPDGYDMMVLKLTNSAISGTKPKLFATSAIHAREYTTAELMTRYAEYLVDNYGIDPDVTWLLDYHEIHLMLHTNPDGRKEAETGQSWRKNTNENYCGATSSNRGADLNRNFSFQWGCCGGSSGSQCSETYRGPSAASEPEVQAVQNYLRAIFPDQRPDPLPDPAPADATGVYLDIHSYSQLVLWPWGFTSTVPPNGPALQTLGRKFAYFNNYTPEQAIGLYPTDGTTDDFAYGDLGVAAYTFELGTQFFESCTAFENTILPANMPALIYAAKVARTPYMTPAGPDALAVTASPTAVAPGTAVNLTATVNDTRYNNSNGAEPTQNIAAAEYYVDTPPWALGATPVAMAASDGNFNSSIEGVTATLDTTGLSNGRHIIFVRGKDAANNWGAISAAFLYIVDPSVAPEIQGYVRQAGTNAPLGATVTAGNFQTTTNPGTGFYHMYVVAGAYQVTASASDHASQTVANVQAQDYQTVQQDFSLTPVCAVYSNDVEQGALSWTGQSPWAITTEKSHSFSHSWTDSPGGNYANNRNISLTSPTIDLSGVSNVSLNFWQICDTEAGWDYCYVEVSSNGGTSWIPLASYDGAHTTWEQITLSAPTLNNVANAKIRFRFYSDTNTVADGWHVDDIKIIGSSASCTTVAPTAPVVTITKSGGQVIVDWTHQGANSAYEVYRSATPYFTPGPATYVTTLIAPTSIYADSSGLGNVDINNNWVIRAKVSGSSLVWDSNVVGEYEFGLQMAP